jgi:hypothetical protein
LGIKSVSFWINREDNKNMGQFIFDVVVGLVVAAISIVAKWQWPLIKSLFDEESRRQARQVSGTWNAVEYFLGSSAKDTFKMEIICRGGRVTGTHTCLSGPDIDKKFNIEGTYKDQILSFVWKPTDDSALESGTVTARFVQDKRLEGHGLYIEPEDGKVYTSKFDATRPKP